MKGGVEGGKGEQREGRGGGGVRNAPELAAFELAVLQEVGPCQVLPKPLEVRVVVAIVVKVEAGAAAQLHQEDMAQAIAVRELLVVVAGHLPGGTLATPRRSASKTSRQSCNSPTRAP